MPNNRMKMENYENFGGINTKASPYITGPHEFLDLVNLDFQFPGDLTSRWGTTQYLQTAANITLPIQSLYEFTKLDGSSYVVTSVTGGIWYGASTGQMQGISLTFQANGISVSYAAPFEWHWFNAGGAFTKTNFIWDTINKEFPYYGSSSVVADGTSLTFLTSGMTQYSNKLDYVTFVNQLWMCDGNKFVRFDGTTTYNVGLPGPVPYFVGSGGATQGLMTKDYWYAFFASYTNNRGFQGPIWPITYFSFFNYEGTTLAARYGSSFLGVDVQLQTPFCYGISAINLYGYQGASTTGFPTIGIDGATFYNSPYRFITTIPISGSTLENVFFNMAGASGNIGVVPTPIDYLPLGITNSPFTKIVSFFPRFLEVYQNRLFLAGFSTAPSQVWFSGSGEPEGYNPEWNLEVRTNDGDRITGMRTYNGKLIIFKKNSFHLLSGDSPDNFYLQEISDEYGCLSNRAIDVYNDYLVFLDRKGLMQFNGANIKCLSDRVQPIFDTINFDAAVDNATMVHDKYRNQLMLGVPVNGATINNLTLVYDYLIPGGAWTKYEGFNPSVFAIMQGRLSSRGVFHGGYSGMVFNHGASLFGDNGTGITCYVKSRFLVGLGQSIEKQYRRLFFNVNEVTSATIPININLFSNYGSSILSSWTMYQNPFQSRIDFGVSAKSLSFEASRFSTSTPFRLHGFVLESRYQRSE